MQIVQICLKQAVLLNIQGFTIINRYDTLFYYVKAGRFEPENRR